jgi:hypothetical protein
MQVRRDPIASAGVGAPPQADPANWEATFRVLDGEVDTTTASPAAADAIAEAELAIGTESGIAALPALGLGGLALLDGVLIGMNLDRQYHISCWIASDCEHADHVGTWTTTALDWEYHDNATAGLFQGPGMYLNTQISGVGDSWHWAWTCSAPCGAYYDVQAVLQASPIGTYYQVELWPGELYQYRYVSAGAFESFLHRTPLAPRLGASAPYWDPAAPAIPDANSPAAAAARARLSTGDPAVDTEIGRFVDPSYAGPGFVMPDCRGTTVTLCESAISSAATAGAVAVPNFSTTTTTEPDAAIVPGGVVDQSTAAGNESSPSAVTLAVNPDPLNGFSGGGSNNNGGDTTTGSSDRCDFDDYAPAKWDVVANAAPEYYDPACAEAWEIARDLGIITESGGINPDWIPASVRITSGELLGNDAVQELLTAGGRSMPEWGKYAIRFETPNGPAEVHFYRMNNSAVVNLVEDFKIVFKTFF